MQDLEGIPASQLKKPLANGRSLLDYRVPKGVALVMNPTVTEVKVTTPVVTKIALTEFWEDVLTEEQRLVYNGKPLNMQNVPLIIKLPDSRTTTLDVNPARSSLKKVIENQRILFEGHELYDYKRLHDYDTPQDETLVITFLNHKANPLRSVTAKLADGSLATVEIDPENIIASIRNTMQHWQGTPEDQRGQQRLAYRGVPLEDGTTLGDYDVLFDGILGFKEPFVVYVHFLESDPKVN